MIRSKELPKPLKVMTIEETTITYYNYIKVDMTDFVQNRELPLRLQAKRDYMDPHCKCLLSPSPDGFSFLPACVSANGPWPQRMFDVFLRFFFQGAKLGEISLFNHTP